MKAMSAIANTTDKAIQDATGKSWDDWKAFLETHNARKLSHKEIVKLLKEEGALENGWWQQMITNTYEQYIGRRKKGEMASGFQIGVSKTLPRPAAKVWEWLLSTEGLQTWLKAPNIPPKHTPFVTDDGVQCELRVLREDTHLRLRWQPGEWTKPAILQVRVTDMGEKSMLTFHQENMPGQEARETMKKHWKEVAERIMAALSPK